MAGKNKKSSWQTPEEYETEKLKNKIYSADKSLKELKANTRDPYTSRNEFKPGFYDQPDKSPITEDTMYGIGKKNFLESETMSPDDSMLVEYKSHGGSVTVKTKLGKTKPTKLY